MRRAAGSMRWLTLLSNFICKLNVSSLAWGRGWNVFHLLIHIASFFRLTRKIGMEVFLVYSDFRERERKRAELKSLKSEYKPGVWNVNSVLLGGLGNEPDVNGKYFPFVSS